MDEPVEVVEPTFEMRDRCGNEPWPCYRADCSNSECMAHRAHFPDCGGYACYCPATPKKVD